MPTEVEPKELSFAIDRPNSPFLLSLDVGTSGVRAALFDDQGNEVQGKHISRHRRITTNTDFAELDADSIVSEIIKAIDQLIDDPSTQQIEYIAISAFWHSLIGVDATGLPTTLVLTWADTRAAQKARELRSRFDERVVHGRTGCRFHPSYWPAKLLWLQTERQESFQKTKYWLGFAEYLTLRLFGDMSASISMASATGLFNQQSVAWDLDFAKNLGLAPNSLPEIRQRQMPVLSSGFRERWPALAGARLAAVLGDGAANNIGGGCSTKDKIALMVGTSGAMRVVYEGTPHGELPAALWSYRVDQTRVVIGGALSDGGGLYQWLTNSLAVDRDPATLQNELSSIEPDSHGLTILPFWSGERSTGWSLDTRGGIFGLTQQTKPIEIVRAALEAIAYRFAFIAQALDVVAPGATIIATGNALRSSPVWPQIISDVLGRPVMFGGSPEASIRGAALLALEAVGKIENIELTFTPVEEIFQPDMSIHDRYKTAMMRQQEIYQLLFAGN